MTLTKYFKLIWISITKPMLIEPAMLINLAILKGEQSATATITWENGTKKRINYLLRSETIK